MYEFSASGLLRKIQHLLFLLAHLPIILAGLWVIGLFYCQPVSLLLLIPFLALLLWRRSRGGTVRIRLWIVLFCTAEAILFYYLPASDAEQWQWGTARLSDITQKGADTLHINNIRDFTHRAENDFDIRYLEEDFNLNELSGVYLAQSYGKGGRCDLMLCFSFNDGRYLVVSPEMRLPTEKEFNSVRAHYKNYGLAYIFGTEEDLFLLRTDIWKTPLWLYPLKATPDQTKQMLLHCSALANDAAQHQRAYTPLSATYANKLTDVLRIICPELPKYGLAVDDLAEELYNHQLIVAENRGAWATAKDSFAVGISIKTERDSYSDTIRRRISLPLRESVPQRHVQEEILAEAPEVSPAEPGTASGEPQDHTFTNAADIPELSDRLAEDNRREAEQRQQDTAAADQEEPSSDTPENSEDEESLAETARKLDEQPSLLPVSGGILEAEDRMRSDDRREAEEDAQLEESRKRAAEGHDITEDINKKKDSDSNFNELFFGKRKSGITIIEKEKPKGKPSPLDPVRRHKSRTPFDDEQHEEEEPTEVDPFEPKKPLKI